MSTAAPEKPINEAKMNEFLGKVVGDFGAALSSSLAYIGQKPGLYKALASGGPMTPALLAEKTSTNERYVPEWLINQAAGGCPSFACSTERVAQARPTSNSLGCTPGDIQLRLPLKFVLFVTGGRRKLVFLQKIPGIAVNLWRQIVVPMIMIGHFGKLK